MQYPVAIRGGFQYACVPGTMLQNQRFEHKIIIFGSQNINPTYFIGRVKKYIKIELSLSATFQLTR
jgi:hypothetical protein